MTRIVWPLMILLVTMLVTLSTPSQANDARPALKVVTIRQTQTPPVIDGSIESQWQEADFAVGFVQNVPYEKTAPSEQTVVYLLQDDANLYVAFRCHARHHPPTANLTKDEDFVKVAFDPFGSRTTGYFFQVYGSGLFWDGLTLDDGRDQDLTWEGVWTRAVKIYPDRMEVEMAIPFKTIRYKKGLSEWGMQFSRHIAASREDDYWTEVPQKEGDLVSRWGEARSVSPQSAGYYFELYPEGFLRYDDYRGEQSKVKPKGSLTLKWDLTPQTSLNLAAYPDFAQIESDPYTVNLSRYPVLLSEQRPFFVEGREIFRLSSFPNSGFFQPLNLFYSRAVGRMVGGEAVPILGGMKLTHKTAEWDIGGLGAVTGSYRNVANGIDEPQRRFGVLRAKRRVLGNSDVGILASGMSAANNDYNYAVGTDVVLRQGGRQFIAQGGMSDRNGKRGWAISSGYKGFNAGMLTMGTYQAVGDSFDVRNVGFVPWVGQQRAMLLTGPYWTFQHGLLQDLYIAPGVVHSREPGSPRWSTQGYLELNGDLRGNWGFDLEGSYGRNYELDDINNAYRGNVYRSASFSFWGVLAGNQINGSCNYEHTYNYQWHYTAYQGSNSLSFSYSFIPPLSATLGTNVWVEWDPKNTVVALWPMIRPRVDVRMSPYMTLAVFNEVASLTPGTALSRTRVQSNRLGGLFSWNFAPKSWIYCAVNDYSELDYSVRPSGALHRQYGVGAVKMKYLVYF